MDAAALMSSESSATSGEMQPTRVLLAYLIEAKFEFFRMLRSPMFLVPFMILPVALFLLLSVVVPMTPGTSVKSSGNFFYTGFATFAILGPSLFAVGCPIAAERDQGLLRLKRALPAPAGSYLVSKVLMQLAFATVGASSVAVAAVLIGRTTLGVEQLISFTAVLVLGTLPFCAIGLFIGTHTSAAAAPGITNCLFFPMIYLSGLFFPLPKALAAWAVVWPTFHLDQLAFAAAGLRQFALFPPAMSASALAGITVLFGGLALRRLARRG